MSMSCLFPNMSYLKISNFLIFLFAHDLKHFRVAPELFSVTGKPNVSNWNLQDGYKDKLVGKSSQEFYPHRVQGTGSLNGLSIILNLLTADLDYICQGPVQGM